MVRRVCLLTGASGTLGVDFCRRYAAEYDIVGVYGSRLPPVASQLQQPIDPLDPFGYDAADRIFAVQADLMQPGEVERVIELTLARFDRVDLLVNAAARPTLAPMLDGTRLVDAAHLELFMNVVVPLRLATTLATAVWRDPPPVDDEDDRCVVNVSSISGVNIYPGLGQSMYAASKAALNFMTLHMAEEFGSIGVRVNAVAPNSFPSMVATEAVTDAIVRFDQSQTTGCILVLDGDEEYTL